MDRIFSAEKKILSYKKKRFYVQHSKSTFHCISSPRHHNTQDLSLAPYNHADIFLYLNI